MEKLKLGSSGLTIPRICLGTNNFGGGRVAQETCNKIMTKALDLGINMFDSADLYTQGNSEKIIGQFIKERREDVIVTTKAGREITNDTNKTSVSRKNIIYQLNQSLSRLQTDYVDLYYVHQYDPSIPIEETMTTLDSLVREGKVRYIACSNYTAQQLEESRQICERLGLEKFIGVQNEYSLLERGMEADLLPYCSGHGVGVLAYSPLGGGLLAGRYEKDKPPPADSRAIYRQGYWKEVNTEEHFKRLERIKYVASKIGVPVSVLAVAWVLRDRRVSTAIVGASRPEQLEESTKAIETKMTPEIIDELSKI